MGHRPHVRLVGHAVEADGRGCAGAVQVVGDGEPEATPDQRQMSAVGGRVLVDEVSVTSRCTGTSIVMSSLLGTWEMGSLAPRHSGYLLQLALVCIFQPLLEGHGAGKLVDRYTGCPMAESSAKGRTHKGSTAVCPAN